MGIGAADLVRIRHSLAYLRFVVIIRGVLRLDRGQNASLSF